VRTVFLAGFMSGGDLSVLLALWFEGEYPLPLITALGGDCASSTNDLLVYYIPLWTTRESYRTRDSILSTVQSLSSLTGSNSFQRFQNRHANAWVSDLFRSAS